MPQRAILFETVNHRVAVLDLGSNTSKLLVAEKATDGSIVPVFQKSYPCRIQLEQNSDISISGRLKILKLLKLLHTESLKYNPSDFLLVGTEVLRKTHNISVLKEEILEKTGLKLKVLTGKQEATTVALGIKTDPNFIDLKTFHAFDLGGGSLELLEFRDNMIVTAQSLPLGSVTLNQRFVEKPESVLSTDLMDQISQHVWQSLENLSELKRDCNFLIGTGGSIAFSKQLIKSISAKHSLTDSNDYQLRQTDLKSLKDELCSLNLEERANKFPTLPIDRLDILPCGLITVLEIMKFLKIDHIAHSFHNLRFGLVANPEITEWA